MSWADDEDDVPCAAVPSFQPPVAVVAPQPRPSLLAPSLPDRDTRDSRTPRVAAAPHSRAPEPTKSKGHQGQREDIARIQQKLSNASGPVSTLADRMGSNPWSKPAAPVGANNAAVGAPKQLQAAPEPQRKPLVLAPRTQPLPVFPAPDQPRTPAPAVFVSTANSQPAASSSTTQTDSAPVTPKPSTPKSDPFGGARPIDEKLAAERRQKLLEEKAQLEATRRAEAKLSLELSAKQPSDKDASKHQDGRPLSARSGWGRSGDRSAGDAGEVKILQRSTEKLTISQPPHAAVVQSVDASAAAAAGRHSHGGGGGGRGGKPSTPREPKRPDSDHSAPSPAVMKGPPQSPKLHSSASGDGHGKAPPKSPNLGPAAASAVVAAAAAAAEGTPSNRGKGKRKDTGGKGKGGADDLPLPFDN